jgi:hypothetical protein
MQVIEALRTSILVPHDHLHIKQMNMPKRVRARTWRPPLPRPAGAQTTQEQHTGLPKLDAQPSAASIRPP